MTLRYIQSESHIYIQIYRKIGPFTRLGWLAPARQQGVLCECSAFLANRKLCTRKIKLIMVCTVQVTCIMYLFIESAVVTD